MMIFLPFPFSAGRSFCLAFLLESAAVDDPDFLLGLLCLNSVERKEVEKKKNKGNDSSEFTNIEISLEMD